MFTIDFLENVYFLYYIVSLLFIMIFLWMVNLKYRLQLIEPLNIVDLVFLQTSLLLIFYHNSPFLIDGILFTLFYIFIRLYSLHLNIKLTIKQRTIPKSLIVWINIIYILLSIYIYMKFYAIHSTGVFKLTWNANYKLLGFIYSFISTVALFNIIYIKKYIKRFSNILIILTVITYLIMGIFFHSKGSFVLLIFLILVYLKINHSKITIKNMLLFIMIIPIGIYIGFGKHIVLFMNRLLKNTDGAFIILQEKLYNLQLFDNNFLIQLFKVISFKVGFKKQEIGETIALYSKYPYPKHGGPNDNILTYFLLNFNIMNVVIYIFIIILLITIVHKNFDKIFKNYYLYNLAIFFYVKAPGFIQAPSTMFLLFGKFLLIFIVIFGLYLLLPKKRAKIEYI